MSKKININSYNNALIMLQKNGLSLNCDKTIYNKYERRRIVDKINKALNPTTLVIDESLFINLGYNEKQMEQIRLGLRIGLDVTPYLNPKFNYLQMFQIRLGITFDLPVSTYANPEINHNKMEIIRKILSENLSTRYILNYNYSTEHMRYIYWGLSKGIDIFEYFDPDLSISEVKKIYNILGKNKPFDFYKDKSCLEYVVKYVKPLDNYKLFLIFRTGEEKIYDMTSMLDLGIFQTLKDVEIFNTATTDRISVVWANGADICPIRLYEDSIPYEGESII